MPILPPALIGEKFIREFFSPILKICIMDMATFTALVKILSLKNYYNNIIKICSHVENLSHENFSYMVVSHYAEINKLCIKSCKNFLELL